MNEPMADEQAKKIMNAIKRHAALEALTFEEVREKVLARSNRWHKGGIEEWSVSDWALAMVGEAGEVANAVKKLRRLECGTPAAKGPKTEDEAVAAIAEEIGGVFLYLLQLAERLGLSLQECVVDEFNRVSEREGFLERLCPPKITREQAYALGMPLALSKAALKERYGVEHVADLPAHHYEDAVCWFAELRSAMTSVASTASL